MEFYRALIDTNKMRHRISMLAINLLFADAIITYCAKLSPKLDGLAIYLLIGLGILFSVFIITPQLIQRFKKLIISFPLLCLIVFPTAIFHIFYHAPLFSLENLQWILVTIHPGLIGIALLVMLLNRWNFKETQVSS